jgi:hypothetical protein
MVRDEIKQALMQLLPPRSESSYFHGSAAAASRPASSANETVLPDSGERDIPPQGRGRETLAEELTMLTRGLIDLGRVMRDREQSFKSEGLGNGFPPAGRSVFQSALSTLTSAQGGAFTLSPLLSGLAGLFRRPSTVEPSSPALYALPPAVAVEAGLNRNGRFQEVTYGRSGQPRPMTGQQAAIHLPPINIQVQAMDSRSFVDHSHEIASAVREAMLTGHGLNDVFAEF